jgi:hypothetical protein
VRVGVGIPAQKQQDLCHPQPRDDWRFVRKFCRVLLARAAVA